MKRTNRKHDLDRAQSEVFDVLVIGGGINGASLYHQLCRQGYKVLLADKGDFASGTSQASAMMVWGGLLYLRNLDFMTVAHLSQDREAMIRHMGGEVEPVSFRYIPSRDCGWNKLIMASGLYFYWMLGLFHRNRPRMETHYPEQIFLKDGEHDPSFLYQEAFLSPSDSRFVLNWITGEEHPNGTALNYCGVTGGEYHAKEKIWRLTLRDELTGWSRVVKTRCVVNCAGVWTDELNRMFRIESPYKHVLSKGVFLGLERPENHRYPLIFDMGHEADVLSYIPWGPVSLWGPTETPLKSLDEAKPEPEDVEFLLERANRHLRKEYGPSDVVSLRCGVRPLAVEKDYHSSHYPLDLSRRHQVVRDPWLPWFSVYGGKFTSCVSLALKVERQLREWKTADRGQVEGNGSRTKAPVQWDRFPGLEEKVPALGWCVEHEKCLTLEDYLRRRTNISQWIPREGLGRDNENVPHLETLAMEFSDGDPVHARKLVLDYMESVENRFDRVLMQYA